MSASNTIQIPPPRKSWLQRWGHLFSIPAILWLMLWFSINTGPGAFDTEPQTLVEWLNAIRSNFQYFVALVGLVYLVTKTSTANALHGPVRMWMIYGLLGLFATVMSPDPSEAFYWAIAYLAAFLAMRAYMNTDDPLAAAEQLNRLNWMVTTLFLLILVFFARDTLLPAIVQEKTVYGQFHGATSTVLEMPTSRSSGMARFAAVPGVVAFAMLWNSKKLKRLFWLALFFASAYLIYLMESRGAIFGMLFAMAFVMLFQGKRSRIIGTIMVSLVGLMLMTDVIPVGAINDVKDYIYRGQSEEDFRTLTGRTRAWDLGLAWGLDSPVIGWGFQADRMLIKEHVHNTYLYVFMTSGFPGLIVFCIGLAWAWILFIKIMRRYNIEDHSRRLILIQAGGILAFFTVRSIPEVCGALFGVDYMVMLPILAYLYILDSKLKVKK